MEFLKMLFDKQFELQKRIIVEDTTMDKLMISNNILDRERVSQHMILAIHAELSELLEWTNWKMWKKTRVVYSEEQLKEIHIELIDILHFWTNLCIIWRLTPEKIKEYYEEKNKENHNRQDNKY